MDRLLPEVAFVFALTSLNVHIPFAEHTDKILPSSLLVYQSALQQSIILNGVDFATDLALVFEPPLLVNVDYNVTVTSPTSAILILLPDRKWRAEPGSLIVRSIGSGDTKFALPHAGVQIATILADPVVHFTAPAPLEGQFLDVMVSGAGFTNIGDTKLTFSPSTIVMDYHIVLVKNNHTMWLEMLIDNSLVKLEDPEDIIDLRIVTIDTGAGAVTLDQEKTNETPKCNTV